MVNIIITAPHSNCLSFEQEEIQRTCDKVSGFAASSLRSSILEKTSHKVIELQSDTHRSISDLNRYNARRTEFRKKVTSLMDDASVLLDVHSFPNERFGGNEFVILDNLPGTSYGKKIDQLMINVRSLLLDGIPSAPSKFEGNDIVSEARSRGLTAILFEYNESLSQSRIHEINDLITTKWIIPNF